MTGHDTELLTELNDLLGNLETMLHTASIGQQVAIESAAESVYGPNEGNHFTTLTQTITDLRERLYDHLEH